MSMSRAAPDRLTQSRARMQASDLLRLDLRQFWLVLFGLSGLINILALTGSIYMMQVYDRALVSGSVETLAFLSALTLGLYLFQGAFDTIRAQTLVRLGARLDRRLAPIAHRIAIDMPRYGYTTTEALERSRMVDTLRGFLSSGAPPALFDLPWMPVFLAFCYVLHPVLGAVTLGGAVVLALLTVVAEVRSRKVSQAVQQALILRNTAAESHSRNSDVLIAMGATERAVDRFVKLNDEHLELQTRTSDSGATISSISRMLRLILQSALLGLGAMLVIGGEMSAGSIIAVSVASARALAPIDQVLGNWRGILAARQAYAQLVETLAAAPAKTRPVDLPLPKDSLKVENLTVASPATGRVLLSDVSFELKAGQALAVLGPSGGGKSTLIRALAGVWSPLRGSVRLDGVNLSQIAQDRLAQVLGYLPQDVNLFDGTIVENIDRFAEQRDSQAIYAAATVAGVHAMIVAMPDGYDTQVGTRGTAMSAGQRQRIGLARALYGAPFLVLLDEPNASLDAAGEKALNETIRTIRDRGGIVVVVAHRSNVLSAVDLVAVVQNGKLAAFGTKESVLANRSGEVAVPAAIGGGARA